MVNQQFNKFTLGNPKNLHSKLCMSQQRFNDQSNSNAIDRKVLRSAFGNSALYNTSGDKLWPLTGHLLNLDGNKNYNVSKLTPFRRAMNAGDTTGTVNKPVNSEILPKPSNQVHVKRTSLAGWKVLAGSAQTVGGNNGSAYSGNPKYVYDGADYVRFKKLQAANRNYNDPTYGGDQSNASQVALARARR